MNEEFLSHIYNTLYKDKIDYNTFKKDFIGNDEFISYTFDKLGYAQKGVTLESFKADLGLNQVNTSNIPSSFNDPNRSKKDRGYRNNNPLNLKYRHKDEFRTFDNLEDGYIAAAKDLGIKLSGKSPKFNENLKKQGKTWGDATLKDLIYTWAPPSDNSAESLATYLKVVQEELGVDPNTTHPSQVDAKKLAIAMSKQESPDSYNTLKNFNSYNARQSNINQQQGFVKDLSLTQIINDEAIKLAEKKLDERYSKLGVKDKFLADIDRSNVFTGLIGSIFDNKPNRLAATDAEIFEAKKELLASGKYGSFKSAEELAIVLDPKYKENIVATANAADRVKQELEDDFNTEGLIEQGSIFGGFGYKKDSKGQKVVNVNPNKLFDFNLTEENYMKIEDVLKLTEHPEITKNRNKYSYTEQKELNQYIRDIQSDLTKSEQVGRSAATGIYNNYLDYASKRAKKLESELTSKYGTLDPKKMSEEIKQQIVSDPLYKDLVELDEAYNKEYETLKTKSEKFKLAEVNDYLQKQFNKKEDENYKKNYSRLGSVEKLLQNTTSFVVDAGKALANVPEDLAVLGGTWVDAGLGTDVATTKTISNAYDAEKIKSSNLTTSLLPSQVKLDGQDIYAIYGKDGKIERFTDGNYFTITDDPNDETFKRLLVEEKKSKNSGKPTTGFNTDSFLHSVREPMVDMVPLIFGGGITKNILTKGASMLGNTGRLANVLTKAANSPGFLTFAGSYAGFTGKMMDQAIKEGGLVDPLDIAVSTTAKVALEAVIERYNPMGGRLFTDKLFSSLTKTQVREFSKIITEQGVFKALPIISKKFSKEILENGLGEKMEEILATIAEPVFVNKILNATLDTSFDENFSIKDVAESALVGMASGFVMGGVLEAGPAAVNAIRNPSSVMQESLRAALQNKQIFDKIIEENKNVDLQNASDQDVEKVKAKYDNIKKIMDNAAIYSEKVFKEHPDTGHVPSSGMQTLYANTAFSKAYKENKKYDLEEDINNNSASIDQDSKKLKELDLFIGAGLDFFNGIADTNREAKIMSNTELKDNYLTVYDNVRDIITRVKDTKNSDAQKLALIKAETKLALINAKNKTEDKVKPEVIDAAEEEVKTERTSAKEEAKELKIKEAIANGVANPEQVQAELTKVKKSVDDLFEGQRKLKDNELPDFSIDLVQDLLENTPDMLKEEVAAYIDKKLEAVNAQAYRQQVKNFNTQQQVAKPTDSVKYSPDISFDNRYSGNVELENSEGDGYKKQYIAELNAEISNYYSIGDDASVLNGLDFIKQVEATSFRNLYLSDSRFRELVDKNTQDVASAPNTAVDQEALQKESDKKAKADAKKAADIAKKQENIADIAKDEELYEAAKVVIKKQYASQAFLVKELGITNEKAKELLQKLEDNGIIGPHVVGKTREIYIKSIEEFNNLVPPVSQSGTANTITVNASGSSVSNIEAKKAEIERLEKEKQETLQPLLEEKEKIEKEIKELEKENVEDTFENRPQKDLEVKSIQETAKMGEVLLSMDNNEKGFKQLKKSIERLFDAFTEVGYKIVLPYESLDNYEVDGDVSKLKEGNTTIVSPVIFYKGKLVQKGKIVIKEETASKKEKETKKTALNVEELNIQKKLRESIKDIELDKENSIEDVEKILNKLGVSKQARFIFSLIKNVAKQLGVTVSFSNGHNIDKSNNGTYSLKGHEIIINLHGIIASPATKNSENISRVIVHEIVHGVTRYLTFIYGVTKGGTKNSELHNVSKDLLTQVQKDAIDNLLGLLKLLKVDENFEGQYGITNIDELLAELTNEDFVSKLKNKKFGNTKKSIFDKILDAISKLLGIEVKEDNYYEKVLLSLQGLLIDPNIQTLKQVTGNVKSKSEFKSLSLEEAFAERTKQSVFFNDITNQLNELKTTALNFGIDLNNISASKTESAKLQQLKNRLKEIERQISEINVKYDAEIKALEQSTSTTQSEIEAKKADINRRRQGLNGIEEIVFSNPNFRLEGFEIDGNYWNVVTSTDRAKVLVNINGVIVPFYLTTGQAGKGLVPGWYPFFGIGKDGWLNKTDKSDMETYYERYWGKETSDIVKSISEELNGFYGTDPSNFKNDGDPNATSRPLSTLADKVEDYINSKLNYTPATNNADARKTLRSNVEQLGKEINAKYDAEIAALKNKEQPTSTTKTPAQQEAIDKINKLIEDGKKAKLIDKADVEIVYTNDIITQEGTKGAAAYDRERNVIEIDKELLKQKFKEKAWTKPRELKEILKGVEVISAAQPLPEKQFKTYEEWEQFVIEHERQHSLYSRQDFNKDFPKGKLGDYESEINKRTLKALALGSHYSFLGKLYKRISNFVNSSPLFDSIKTVTNLKNSVVVGNYFDTFARLYFKNPNLTIEEFEIELQKRKDYKQFSNISTKDIFNDNIKRFNELKKQIQEKHNDPNLIFITDEIFVHQDKEVETANTTGFAGVAGTLDMVVIDSQGQVHIYDFKTKSENHLKYPVTKESLEVNSFDGIPDNKKWSNQQTAYSTILKNTLGYSPSINIVVIPAKYTPEAYNGDLGQTSIDTFKPSPTVTTLAKTAPFIYVLSESKETINKFNSLKAQQPVPPVQVSKPKVADELPVVSGRISVTANGYNALNIADNLLVTDYLKAGDPVFYELSAKSTDTEPVIEKVVYYKDKRFGQPIKGSKRIVLQEGFGKDEYKLTERFANEIKAGKERIETKVTYINLNKAKKLTPDNKKQLSIEEIETIKPYLYVIGKSFSSNENIVLLNNESDGKNFLSISGFIERLKDKHPDLKDFQEVENILRHEDVNGKVVFVKGNTIIPLDTITNEEYAPNKKFITEFLDKLSSEATGMADWRIDINGRFLSEAVRKRSDVKDYTNETSPNFRGRLVEYFASGPQHRQTNPTEVLYKIKYDEEKGKSEPIYLTKEQALEELLAIRVNIDHAELRAKESSKDFNSLLADVLRVPSTPAKGFAILYNVVGLEDVDDISTKLTAPETIELESEEIITPKEKETKKTTTIEELKTEEPEQKESKERAGRKKRTDWKLSDRDYTGKVEDAVAYIKTRFEEIGVEVDDNVLRNLVKGTAAEGSKVWGAFHNAMVTLASLSGEKIGRHESAHIAEVMFHTDSQLKDLRQQMLSRWGKELGITKTKVSDLTDNELKAIREKFADTFEEYKNTLIIDNDSNFAKKYPIIAKFINNLFLFLKNNYIIGRSYITNKKSIDQLFYEVENNILGRDFIGRRKKSVRDTFQKALDNLSEKDKPDFKISDWNNEEVKKFANFLATDMFTKYLESTYRNSSVNEIIANNKNLSIETIINAFSSNLEKTLNNYKDAVTKREELETSSDEYQILEATLNDIYKQYASKEANKAFKRIVNKKIGDRYAGTLDLDKLDLEDLKLNDEDVKEEDNDIERSDLESWQTKAGRVDAKTKSSARLREFFSSIPLRTRLINDGKSERRTITDEDLFTTLYYSGEYIHNKLLLELSNNNNYEDFIKAVNGLVKKHQFGGDILAAIMNLTEEQLVEAYDNNTLELPLDIFINPKAYSDYKLWILKDMYYAIGDQSNFQPIKTLITSQGGVVKDVQLGLSVQNTDYDNATRTIKESVDAILIDPSKRESFKTLLDQTITAINEKGKIASLIIEVFTEIGYQISDELLLNLQRTSSIDGRENNLIHLKYALLDLKDIIDEEKNNFNITTEGIAVPAKLISTYSTVSSGLSYMNVEGENEFALQNSYHLSRVNNIWTKGSAAIKEWVNNRRYVNGDPNKPIVLQSHLPIYEDMQDPSKKYRIYQDGGTQVEGQPNSGKAYADMTLAEITAHSINLFLTRNSLKNAGNTLEKMHALFHFLVFSDSPKRQILQAPVYAGAPGHRTIINKLSQIVYGELERVFYTKNNESLKELDKLGSGGHLLHTIPELNDVKIEYNGKFIPFADFFSVDLWTNPNSSVIIPEITKFSGIDKQGRPFEKPLKGGTHREILNRIISDIVYENYNHFLATVYTSDVRKLISVNSDNYDIADYYYNSYYYNISTSIMFSGDPAHYKLKNGSPNVEKVKRDKQNVTPNTRFAFEKEKYDVMILNDVKANTSNVANKEIAADLADASAWHTLERRLEILKASSNWELIKGDIEKPLENIANNNYTLDDLKAVHLQMLKPFVYATIDKEISITKDGKPSTLYFKIPIQLKNSEAVLLPTEAYRVKGNSTSYVRPESLADITADKYHSPELARTLYLMEKTNVGTVVFESGSKAEIFGKVDINKFTEKTITEINNTDPTNNLKTRDKYVLNLDNASWGNQQEVSMKAKVRQGAQEHKNMSANVDPDWSFTMESTGEEFKGQEGANEAMQRIQEVFVKENLDKIKKELTNEDGSLNKNKALEIIRDSLIENFTNVDVIEGTEIQSDGKTLVPLELFGKKGEKILNSIFKKLSKIKLSGAALVNKTSVGYVRDVEYDGKEGQLTPSNDLQLIRDKNGNILYYEAIVPVYDPIIYQFIDNNGELILIPELGEDGKPVIDKNGKPVMKPAIPEKLLYAFFYRIPTEDKYSMFPIKIKKFSMPVEGGGIILPREATAVAGLDFDIDKLYGYYYNFRVNYPQEFKDFAIKKFTKFLGSDATKYFDALEDKTLVSDFTEKELENFDILKANIEPYKKDYEYLGNKFLTKTEDFIKIVESSFKNSKTAHNLKLDIYFSIVNTKAYTRDALTPGNKERLEKLVEELEKGSANIKYSFADPTFVVRVANKNIVGKRLIGVFANANSFYNLIQGVTKLVLKKPITFTANGIDYTFNSIGGINHQISKNIAELLFASTEDVKNPVLEALNINTHTAPLLVTLLTMTNGTDIIKFEDAIKLLSDSSILDAVKEAESEGKRFASVYPKYGRYYDLVQIAEKYNAIVFASKIDQAIGPDFYTVQNKLENIDTILSDSRTMPYYPFTATSVAEILPSTNNMSKIKQLNIFREGLNLEIELFKELFSFLKPAVLNNLRILAGFSKNGKLGASIKYTIAYIMYDAAIQNLYGPVVIKELTENFPAKLLAYKYPEGTGILKQAFEINKKGIVKMRWVNINATDILDQYKEAFSDLFTSDPKMAEELAKYAFLTGTKFKMDSIVKIIPNEFYTTDTGKKIRDIINGNALEDNLPQNIVDSIMLNHYKLILPKEEVVINKNIISLKNKSFGEAKAFIWNSDGTQDTIYELVDAEDFIYRVYHVVEKTKFPNYLINIKNNATFAENNNMGALNKGTAVSQASSNTTEQGKQAIRDVYTNTFNNNSPLNGDDITHCTQ